MLYLIFWISLIHGATTHVVNVVDLKNKANPEIPHGIFHMSVLEKKKWNDLYVALSSRSLLRTLHGERQQQHNVTLDFKVKTP